MADFLHNSKVDDENQEKNLELHLQEGASSDLQNTNAILSREML